MIWLAVAALVIAFLVWRELAAIRRGLDRRSHRPAEPVIIDSPKTELDRFTAARARVLRILIEETPPNGTLFVTSEAEKGNLLANMIPALGRPDVSILVDIEKAPLPPVVQDYQLWIEAERRAESCVNSPGNSSLTD